MNIVLTNKKNIWNNPYIVLFNIIVYSTLAINFRILIYLAINKILISGLYDNSAKNAIISNINTFL